MMLIFCFQFVDVHKGLDLSERMWTGRGGDGVKTPDFCGRHKWIMNGPQSITISFDRVLVK
jgi:hypothetical protein